MKKLAYCVYVYKHRSDCLLGNLKKIKGFDVFIVTQGNDPKLDEYQQYIGGNVNIMHFEDATSIFMKRDMLLQKLVELGYDGVIMTDDDICFNGKKITPETKRTTSDSYRAIPCDYQELLDVLVKTAEEKDAGYVTFVFPPYIGFQKPGKINVNRGINTAPFHYIDLDKVRDNNLHFDTSGSVHEDIMFVVDMLRKHINVAIICDYTYTYHGTQKTSTIGNNIEDLFKLQMYIDNGFKMAVKKDGHLRNTIPYTKIYENKFVPVWDDELVKLCKQKDVNAVKDYLLKNK